LFEVKTNGDTVIGGILTVSGTGTSTFAGDVSIGGSLTVDGTIQGGTTVDLGQDLVIQGNLQVNGNTSLGDNASVDTTTIKGVTRVISKATKALGSASISSFQVESADALPLFQVMENGDAKIAGVLTVSGTGGGGGGGSTGISGDLTVENLIVNQNLTVKGNTTIGDNAAIDTTTIKGITSVISKTTKALGSATVNAFNVKDSAGSAIFEVMENGDTVIAGVLTVKGTGESTFAGDVKIGGNLTVDGDATVKGLMTGNTFNIQGDLLVDGNTTLGNNSAVDSTNILGYTQIKTAAIKSAAGAATTSVFKIVDASATPLVLFDVRQNGDLSLAGGLTVSGTSTSTQDLTVAGNFAVNGNTTLGDAAGDLVTVRGTATFQQDIAMSNKRITGLAEPTGAQDAATKAYVDATKMGLDVKDSVRVATTANITLSAVQTIDGIAVVAGDRVLVKNQTTGSQNGIYIVAAGAWTRSADCDNVGGSEVTSGLFTFVEDGTSNANSGWLLTTLNPIVINTTALVFTQFSGAGSFTAGAGLTQSGNTINVVGTANRIVVNADSVDIASNYAGQNTITTLGTVTTGVWNGTDIAVADGGTGSSTAAGARSNLGATGKYAADVGNGALTVISIPHALGSQDVVVSVREKATNQTVFCDIEHFDTNTVKLYFGTAPAANAYRVTVVG
jgi:predicted acyltransferase (DUF342 family)